MRTPWMPAAFGHRCKIGIVERGSGVDETGRLLLQLDEAERAVVEHHDLDRQAKLLGGQQGRPSAW